MIRRSRSLRAVAVSAALATSCMLASCTAADAAPTTDPDLLRVAVAGAPSDTLDLTRATTSMPFAVGFNVFDSVVVQEGGSVSLQAVDSAEPDEAGTRWRLHVRPGTAFHDGAAVTAADVLYSLRYLGSSATYGSLCNDVDLDASTTEGDDESYSVDSGAVLTANAEYWQGEPAVGRIDIVPIADAATRLSALGDPAVLGGDVVWGVRPDVYGAIPGLDGVEMSQSVPVLHDATIRG